MSYQVQKSSRKLGCWREVSGLTEFAALCANYDVRKASGKVRRVKHDIVKVVTFFIFGSVDPRKMMHMPKDFSLTATPPSAQRMPEYARDDEWIRDFLHHAQIGHVATRWDDQPFITPTTFWYDQKRHQIVFHSNLVGRVRANIESHNRVCFETNENGQLLPSNVALEFSVQYASVVAFGTAHIIEDADEKRRALYGLIGKYFPEMTAGKEFRPITDQELRRTTVYAISVESWSGKENWPQEAEQSDEWPPLATQS